MSRSLPHFIINMLDELELKTSPLTGEFPGGILNRENFFLTSIHMINTVYLNSKHLMLENHRFTYQQLFELSVHYELIISIENIHIWDLRNLKNNLLKDLLKCLLWGLSCFSSGMVHLIEEKPDHMRAYMRFNAANEWLVYCNTIIMKDKFDKNRIEKNLRSLKFTRSNSTLDNETLLKVKEIAFNNPNITQTVLFKKLGYKGSRYTKDGKFIWFLFNKFKRKNLS